MMSNESKNGNTQLNSESTNLNNRVSKFTMLGKTKRVQWEEKRRNRTI